MSRRNGSPATMEDVALMANVSTMTVSRALHQPTKVAKETRAKIDKAVRETGFILNAAAGNLRTARPSQVVVVIVPTLKNSLFTETLQGIADGLRQSRFHLMVGDSRQSKEEEENLIRAFLTQRPSGMILHETKHTDAARKSLLRANIPLVEIGDLAANPLDSTVSYSNRAASQSMVKHLLEQGYRRVAFVGLSSSRNTRAQCRLQGYQQALAEAKIKFDPRLVKETSGELSAGADSVVDLLTAKSPPDAIFFAGGVLAIGALLECSRRNWKVPEKVGIASYDNFEVGQWLEPRLTSLKIPRYEIGRTAAAVILQGVDRPTFSRQQLVSDLGFEVMAARSTQRKA